MKLSLDQIKSIAQGCARIINDNGKIKLSRFTEEQERFFVNTPLGISRTLATAGVRLEFITNSQSLTLKVDVSPSTSRTWFCHDIFINGEKKYTLSSDLSSSPDGHMCLDGSYALGSGKKKVCIYFPWSVESDLISLELDNGAFVMPVKHSKRILIFGDSITQGADAASPSEAYASRLTDALDAESRNKAVGGDVFHAEFARLPEDFCPDIITVSYGTNDWETRTKEEFDTNCEQFYANLCEHYPDARIFALTPIWRETEGRVTAVGEVDYVSGKIRSSVQTLPNVSVIDCIDFVPHSPEMYSPDILHPNSEGFAHYAENVISAIKGELGID